VLRRRFAFDKRQSELILSRSVFLAELSFQLDACWRGVVGSEATDGSADAVCLSASRRRAEPQRAGANHASMAGVPRHGRVGGLGFVEVLGLDGAELGRDDCLVHERGELSD
jgi:hypothetical protein